MAYYSHLKFRGETPLRGEDEESLYTLLFYNVSRHYYGKNKYVQHLEATLGANITSWDYYNFIGEDIMVMIDLLWTFK